ncbi:anthranilate phosphoribosyltransferase [Plebeiibacterium sediminum]|uniref:Anthranilate phosphoribosyltransferase n=1 Tax=Plebeiibacterium sediminum TaxID=2992112 RepID=A0AAE3SFE4_9BACT|nr:anthranilate phosphoribosyltransferase [Plebeiobacterium sediminum]MCW3786093.1 anthranilate phosphoribosyltransferase [Plebeiobacterium sediminum]
MIKETLRTLLEHKRLTRTEAKEILTDIAQEKYNASHVVAFLSVYMMRPVSVEELSGFRDAFLDLCVRIDLSEFNAIDIVGTGGDEKNTFNISTLSSFVVAGAGYKVTKHGNYGVSSSCGASNVMEHLGYQFTNDESRLKKQVDEAGICFLHAPLFHPAMKSVAPFRRELGLKTFFNMLGPLVNPSFPKNQMLGVYSLEVLRLYQYLYQDTDKNYSLIHSLDGYDEISMTSEFKVITNKGEQLVSPEQLGFKKIKQEDIFGGDTVPEAAKIFTDIINGDGTDAQNSAIIVNAAYAIQCIDRSKSIEECIEMAKASLLGGKAKQVFKTLIDIK